MEVREPRVTLQSLFGGEPTSTQQTVDLRPVCSFTLFIRCSIWAVLLWVTVSVVSDNQATLQFERQMQLQCSGIFFCNNCEVAKCTREFSFTSKNTTLSHLCTKTTTVTYIFTMYWQHTYWNRWEFNIGKASIPSCLLVFDEADVARRHFGVGRQYVQNPINSWIRGNVFNNYSC